MYEKRVDVNKSAEEKLQQSIYSDDSNDNKSIINEKWLDLDNKDNKKRKKHEECSRNRHRRESKKNCKKDVKKSENIWDMQSQVDVYVNITSDDSIEDNANCDYEDNADDSDASSSSNSSNDSTTTTSSSNEEKMKSNRTNKNVIHQHHTKEKNIGKLEKKINTTAENSTNKRNANVRPDNSVWSEETAATNATKHQEFILTSWEECSHKSTSAKRKGKKEKNKTSKSSNLFKKLWHIFVGHDDNKADDTSSESNETNVEQECKMSEEISSESSLSNKKTSELEKKWESQLRTNDKSYTSPLSIEYKNSKQEETIMHRKRENSKEAELHMSDKKWIHVRDSSENSNQYALWSSENLKNYYNNNRNDTVSTTTRSITNNKEEQQCQPIERFIQKESIACNLPSDLSNCKAKSDSIDVSTCNNRSDLFRTGDNATNCSTVNFPSMPSIYSPFACNTITQKRNSNSNNCNKYNSNTFINDYSYDDTLPELYSKKVIYNSNNELERNASLSYNLSSIGMNSIYNNNINVDTNDDDVIFDRRHELHNFNNVISSSYGEPVVENHNSLQTESATLHQLPMYAVSNQDDKNYPYCFYSRPSSSRCSSFNESSVSSIGPTGLPESISSFRWIPFNGGCGYNPFMQHCEDNPNVDLQKRLDWKEHVQENNYEIYYNDHNMIVSSLQSPPPPPQQQQPQQQEEVENYKQNARQPLLELVKDKKNAQFNYKSSDVNETKATTIDEVVLYPFYGPVGFIGQEASCKREEWEYKHGACGLTERTYIFSATHPLCKSNDLSTPMQNSHNNDDKNNISLMTRIWCDTDILENAPRIVSPVWEYLYNEEVDDDDGNNNNNNNNNINNTINTFADENKNNNFAIAVNDENYNKLTINDDKIRESRQRRLTLPPSPSPSPSPLQKLYEEKKNEHDEEENELYNYRGNDKNVSVNKDEDEDEDGDDYNVDEYRKINNTDTKIDYDTYSMIDATSPDPINNENIGSLQFAEEPFPLEISKISARQTLPKILEPHPPFSSRRKTLPFNTLPTNYRLPEINVTSSTSNTRKNCQALPPLPPREDCLN